MLRFAMLLYLVLSVIFVSESFCDETFDKLFNSKKYKDAIKYADQKIPPASRNSDIWVKIAVANEQTRLIEKALASYMVAWRMDPKNYDALIGVARIYNKLKQYDNGMTYAKKALEQNFTGEASWEYARACIALKKPAEAKKALEKVIETDPTNVVANRELGIIYYNDKKYSKAISLLKKAYDKKASEGIAYQIGKSYLETGKIDSAIDFLKKSLKDKSITYKVGLELARAYYKIEKYNEAAEEYKRIEGKVQMGAEDYFSEAMSLEKLDKKSEAIESFRSAVKKYGSSKDKEALISRHKVGVADLEKKQYSDALAQFQFIITADPKALLIKDCYFLIADAYLGTKNSTKAIQSLEKAISMDQSNIEAYARLADMYSKNNMQAKAKATYEKMMSLSPNDPNVYLILGEYNLKANKYQEALDLFVKSNGLKKNATALEGIAVSASKLNQWGKARDAAESAVNIDPSLLPSRIILAEVLMKDKSYKDAKTHLEILVSKKPATIKYWEDLATCYEKLKDSSKLAEADKKIIELDKKNTASRLRHAEYALSKKDIETAYTLYKELAVLMPKNADVFKSLFIIAKEKKDKANEITYLKKYLTLNPNDAELQRDLGDILYEKKDLNGALVAYRKALKINPAIKGFYKRYAEIVLAKGQQNEVITALTGVIKAGEGDFGTYTTLGMIYMKKKMYSKSKEMYQKALMIEPQNIEALCALGDCQAALGDISGAVITYEQVIMMNPKAGEEYKALGDLYIKQKKEKQAMKSYAKYLDKVPTDEAVAKTVGDYLYEKKKYKHAVKYLSIVKGKEAQSFLHQLKLGESYFHAKKYKDAITIFNVLLKRNPKIDAKKDILMMKAEAYEKTGDTAKALITYDAFIKLKGVRNADVAFKRAFLREKKEPVVAQKIYAQNITQYPSDSRNYLQLGLLYSKNKATIEKAAPMLEKAASKAGKDKSLWLKIAKIYGELGKENQELAAYKKYINADPQNLDANIRIGTILMDKGKTTEGMIYLETANTISPNNIKIMGPLATGYLKTNRTKEAMALLQKAKELKPDDLDIRKRLFETHIKLGDKKSAMLEMKELLGKKRDPSLLLFYAKMLLEEGKTKEAENALEDIMAVNPENIDALMLLAKVQRAKKKLNDAIETYKEIIYIDANYAPALYERAETYMEQSKPQWAERFYDRALRADPKYGLAELGMATISKLRKDEAGYKAHLKKARQLDPDNPKIKEECKKAGL